MIGCHSGYGIKRGEVKKGGEEGDERRRGDFRNTATNAGVRRG